MQIYSLNCRYDSRQSFYDKAKVIVKNNIKVLTSYDTPVALIEDDKVYIDNLYSQTTLRHIKEFLKQNGYDALTKKQILTEYKATGIFNKKIKKFFEK